MMKENRKLLIMVIMITVVMIKDNFKSSIVSIKKLDNSNNFD